jgi:hypothetical protein
LNTSALDLCSDLIDDVVFILWGIQIGNFS